MIWQKKNLDLNNTTTKPLNHNKMKLYTEQQVKNIIGKAQMLDCDDKFLFSEDYLIKSQTAIELPSDEEIEQYLKSFPYTKHLDDGQYNDGVIVGAELTIEWMRSKILNL